MPSEANSELLRYQPARSQGKSNECTAYAVVAAMESWILRHRPEVEEHLPLSESDLFRMIPHGKDSVRAALIVAQAYGIVEQGASPERAELHPAVRKKYPDAFWRVNYTSVPDASTPQRKQILMMKALKQGYPLVTSIYVDKPFLRHRGTAYKHTESRLAAAHAICIIGYNREEGYWIAKNSMGPDWGTRGGCFAFRFGDPDLIAEHLVWQVQEVVPPSHLRP